MWGLVLMGGDGGNFFLARVINLMVGNVLLVYNEYNEWDFCWSV